jgi:hypothetical protein
MPVVGKLLNYILCAPQPNRQMAESSQMHFNPEYAIENLFRIEMPSKQGFSSL